MRKFLNFAAWLSLFGGIVGGLILSIMANRTEVIVSRGWSVTTEIEFNFGGFLLTYIPTLLGAIAVFSFLRVFLEMDARITALHPSLPRKPEREIDLDIGAKQD